MSRVINTRLICQRVGLVTTTKYVRAWRKRFHWCLICGISEARAKTSRWPGLQTMHIIGGSGRSNEPCNVLLGCGRDHHLEHLGPTWNGVEYGTITLAHLLWVKRERDPWNWNPERLAVLRGEALPEPEPLPELFLAEWRRWKR